MYNDSDKFYIIDKNYDVVEMIEGIKNLARKVDPIIRNGELADNFKVISLRWVGDVRIWVSPKINYIIHDSDGNIVSVKLIKSIKYKSSWDRVHPSEERFLSYRRHDWHKWEFRKDPVPGTGKGKQYKCYYRTNPKIMSDLRVDNTDGMRPNRHTDLKYLVTYLKYDEIYRASSRDKFSWKKTKKRKQWM